MSPIQPLRRSVLALFGAIAIGTVASRVVAAAEAAAELPSSAPMSPKAGALIDLTGNWVSIVNEDWRFRMVTPPKGDYEGLVLAPEGRKQADTWTAAMDGSCKAYGVGGIMRMPTRLKIDWEGDDVLKIETDAGMQTRRLRFTHAPTSGPRTLQGYSLASWQKLIPPPPPPPVAVPIPPLPPPSGGTLKVTTMHHTGGWLRRNGAPYSENASIVEYFDRWPGLDGAQWLSVTTVVEDPVNLLQPSYTSSHFRKEPDASKWWPAPCTPIAD